MPSEHKAINAMHVAENCDIKSERGFTLVEMMIIITIIAILAAVAVQNFVRYRKISQMNACIANLSKIHVAYEQAKMAGESPSDVAALCGQQAYLSSIPVCPASNSNTYSLPAVDGDCPTCSNSTEEYPHVFQAGPSS